MTNSVLETISRVLDMSWFGLLIMQDDQFTRIRAGDEGLIHRCLLIDQYRYPAEQGRPQLPTNSCILSLHWDANYRIVFICGI